MKKFSDSINNPNARERIAADFLNSILKKYGNSVDAGESLDEKINSISDTQADTITDTEKKSAEFEFDEER